MTLLAREIASRIARSGPMPVDAYMRLCLSDPEHGYYRTRPAIGISGDFITAPEISQVFGELIGVWAAAIWDAIGQPATLRLVELGPGRGTLMADALRAIGKVAPALRAALAVHLVEINPGLRQQQAATLAGSSPRWHDDTATLPDGPLIVIANEFFDALPIRQFLRAADGWRERTIGLDGDRLVFVAGRSVPPLPRDAPIGSVAETSHERTALIGDIARRIARHRGAALIVDYGPFDSGFGDTFQAIREHKKVDPLAEPGLADLTAHVDFAALAAAARSAGATAYGPIPQGALMRRMGIAARAAVLMKNVDTARAALIAAAIGRLIEPDQMGTLFKALAILDARQPVPPGFDAPLQRP